MSRRSSGPDRCSPTTARRPRSRTPCAPAEKWFNDGVWKDHFIPTQNAILSDLLGKDSEFASGNLAMNEVHTWFACCVNPAAPAKPIVGDNFGWAVAPSSNGETTAKLHADTFSMLKTTKHPDATFDVLSALAASGDLADHLRRDAGRSDPAAGLQRLGHKDVPEGEARLVVPAQSLEHPDIPNHQAWVPDYAKSKTAWQAFWNKYRTTPSLDIDAELDTLKTTLQGIFDAAPDKNP